MLTVGQAAERLGVGPEQVRRLIRAGKLAAHRVGRTLVLDDDAVYGRARLPITAGRALAPRTVWAALWRLSGEDVDWLSAADRSRLVARLRGYNAERLFAASSDRAAAPGIARGSWPGFNRQRACPDRRVLALLPPTLPDARP